MIPAPGRGESALGLQTAGVLGESCDLGLDCLSMIGQSQEFHAEGRSRRIRLVAPKRHHWIRGPKRLVKLFEILFRRVPVQGDEKIVGGWIIVMKQVEDTPAPLATCRTVTAA